MTIDEAITYLEDLRVVELHKLNTYTPAALKLGIEALKRVGAYRHFPDRGPGELLPGETKE